MSLLKRLSATVFSRVDQVVSEIENHDAVIDAAIKDARRHAAQAKVRLNRVHTDGQRLRARLTGLREAEEKWTQRARESAESDEATALECLRRRRQSQAQASAVETSLTKHAEVEQRLQRDVARLESRVSEISQQRNLMRTREAAAETVRKLQAMEICGGIDIDDTFERWEVRVAEAEMASGDTLLADEPDTLERQFLDTEERAELRAELDALVQDKEV